MQFCSKEGEEDVCESSQEVDGSGRRTGLTAIPWVVGQAIGSELASQDDDMVVSWAHHYN